MNIHAKYKKVLLGEEIITDLWYPSIEIDKGKIPQITKFTGYSALLTEIQRGQSQTSTKERLLPIVK